MVNLTEKAAIVSFSEILMRLSTIFSGIIVVRWLSQEQLGSFRQVTLIFSICTMLLLLGIPNSIYFFVPKAEDHEKRGILFQTYLTLFLIGGISGVIIYLWAPTIALQFNNVKLTHLIQRYSPYLAFSLPLAGFFAAMMSLNKVVRASVCRTGITLAQIGAILVPILIKCRLITVFTTMLAVNSVIAVASIWYSLTISPKGPLSLVKGFGFKQLRFSLPLGIGQMASLVAKEIDKFFIAIFFSVEQFAVYSVGAIQLPISLFVSSIRTVLLPEFVKNLQNNHKQEMLSTWKESRRKLALISFPIISLFFFISPEFLTFVYGDRYHDSVIIFQIYLLIPLLSNFESSVLLHAKGKTKLILYASLANLTSNVILNYFLIQLIGVKGPPIATILAQLLGFGVIFKWISKELKISWLSLFPWHQYKNMMFVCFLGGIPIIFLRHFGLFSSKFYFLIFSGILFGSILCGVYLLFILERRDLQLLQKHLLRIPVFNPFLVAVINKIIIKKDLNRGTE